MTSLPTITLDALATVTGGYNNQPQQFTGGPQFTRQSQSAGQQPQDDGMQGAAPQEMSSSGSSGFDKFLAVLNSPGFSQIVSSFGNVIST
jgi:hypothetical protein